MRQGPWTGRYPAAATMVIFALVRVPFRVGFIPARTGAQGASLADAAGFRAQSLALEEAETWKGIARVADERDASLIVLCSHSRRGLSGAFHRSVTGAVAAHAVRGVLIVHMRA